MAGKINDEQLFEAEKRMKRCELIIGQMTDEERTNPDLLVRQGGKMQLVKEAVLRRADLAKRCEIDVKDVSVLMHLFTIPLLHSSHCCQ